MKYCYLAIMLVCAAVLMNAQPPSFPPDQPKRTPEEIARKQTSMLVRELNLKDSMVIDSLYRINVRHNKRREAGQTRAQEFEGMQFFLSELKGILTPEQYNQFMNQKVDKPRHPHAPYAPARPDSINRRPPVL